VGGGSIIFLIFFLYWWRRRLSRSSLTNANLQTTVQELARAGFLREYRHNVKNNRDFFMSFGRLQLPYKRVQLERELGRMGSTVVYKALVLPVKQQVAVRCQENKSLESQSLLLCEAMVLHLFRHGNILALLHVCRLFTVFSFVLFRFSSLIQSVFIPPFSSERIPIYIVTEYMANGDLRTFLRACRPASAKLRQSLTNADLFAIAQKALAAMVFLESKHIIHRGLAAKHYLVGQHPTDIRLANLGKTRDIYVVCAVLRLLVSLVSP
jgi:serine/threonine protein kinase